MNHFRFILFIEVAILTFVLYKNQNENIKNKYYIYYIYTISWFLFIFSLLKSPLPNDLSVLFDIFMTFYVVLNMVKILNSKKFQILNLEKIKLYLIFFIWSIYGFSVILALRDIF